MLKTDLGSLTLWLTVDGRLVTGRGTLVPEPGKKGEICVRSPRLMSGYLGNARATSESFVDGWLKTGDVGRIDRHGRIFVVDRQKVSLPTMAGTR